MDADSAPCPLSAAQDGDYAVCFRALTAVEVEIRKEGPRPALLLRRSMLQIQMGDLKRGLESAQDAVAAAPRDAESHFQEGVAWSALARLRAGATVLGPRVDAPPAGTLAQALESAYEAFCAAARCRPTDPDARAHLEFLEEVLAHDGDEMATAFLAHVVTL